MKFLVFVVFAICLVALEVAGAAPPTTPQPTCTAAKCSAYCKIWFCTVGTCIPPRRSLCRCSQCQGVQPLPIPILV